MREQKTQLNAAKTRKKRQKKVTAQVSFTEDTDKDIDTTEIEVDWI